ncbi:MAG: hypothetical protein H7844_09310 [Nitrospirae bacterium YQR-1]
MGKNIQCGIKFIKSKCDISCNRCIDICPIGAIKKYDNKSIVDFSKSKCFSCGICVKLINPENPYLCKALQPNSHNRRVMKWISDKETFGVIIGPGLEFFSKEISLYKVVAAFKEMNAALVYRTINYAGKALENIVTEVESRFTSNANSLIIDSRCGSIVNIIRKHRPDLEGNLVKAKSTLFTSASLLKSELPNTAKIVFVGPNISYKETIVYHPQNTGLVNAVLTWHEFVLLSRDILNKSLESLPDHSFDDKETEGFVPLGTQISDILSQKKIICHSLSHMSPKGIVGYFNNVKKDQTKGFVESLFCEMCTYGPGVYSGWVDEQVSTTRKQTKKIQSEAILVVDMCNSTATANIYGDQLANQLKGILKEKVEKKATSENAQFKKSTGDGFLLTFKKLKNAICFAVDLLNDMACYNEHMDDSSKIQLHFAINFGETTIVDTTGDRSGHAVNMTFRVDGVKTSDLHTLNGETNGIELPLVNRILITENVVNIATQLDGIDFQPVGYFKLKDISGLHRIYLLQQKNQI